MKANKKVLIISCLAVAMMNLSGCAAKVKTVDTYREGIKLCIDNNFSTMSKMKAKKLGLSDGFIENLTEIADAVKANPKDKKEKVDVILQESRQGYNSEGVTFYRMFVTGTKQRTNGYSMMEYKCYLNSDSDLAECTYNGYKYLTEEDVSNESKTGHIN